MIVTICWEGFVNLYTFKEPDGSLQRRITYLFQKCHRSSHPLHTQLFAPVRRSTAQQLPNLCQLRAHSGVTNDGSEVLYKEDVILVIDMDIPSGTVLHSETPVKISWADRVLSMCGFPHHFSHGVIVFGSKMAYGLPQDRTPESGQRREEPSTDKYMYVQTWDFNKGGGHHRSFEK